MVHPPRLVLRLGEERLPHERVLVRQDVRGNAAVAARAESVRRTRVRARQVRGAMVPGGVVGEVAFDFRLAEPQLRTRGDHGGFVAYGRTIAIVIARRRRFGFSQRSLRSLSLASRAPRGRVSSAPPFAAASRTAVAPAVEVPVIQVEQGLGHREFRREQDATGNRVRRQTPSRVSGIQSRRPSRFLNRDAPRDAPLPVPRVALRVFPQTALGERELVRESARTNAFVQGRSFGSDETRRGRRRRLSERSPLGGSSAVSTSGLISRSLAVTAMDVASYTFSRRRRIASSCNARMSSPSATSLRSRSCHEEKERARGQSRRGGGSTGVRTGERRGPWRGVGCCTSTEAETYLDASRSRVCGIASRRRRTQRTSGAPLEVACAPEDLSFRSSSLLLFAN